ncbi:MAG TPA: VWA domain-containing protein [Thermoanaerobaculia bacterium]|nr:VWA domain-containing protein [Thermoanaerobaculia bacterium]
MKRLLHSTLLALAVLVLLPVLGSAAVAERSAGSSAPPPRFQDQANVNEVLLDVLVTDPQGHVIVGLDKNDFVVRENGKPVPLTGVTFYSNRRFLESDEAVAARRLNVDRVTENRYFVLFFDASGARSGRSSRLLVRAMDAGHQAEKWADELLPNDYVAVVSYDFKLKVQQDFTRDRRALVAAIGNAIQGKDPGGVPGNGPSLLASLPRGNKLRDRTPTIYEGIQVLADSLHGITGRKNLVLFTSGFGLVNDFRQYIPDLRYYPPMVRALNDSNVAVYPVDLGRPGAINRPLANAMNELAAETGGRYYFNFVNFATPLQQIAKENSGYYLLSYEATHAGEGNGFQKVEVRTTNPEFKVRTREGYDYGSGAATGGR